ncbi:expressed unknown protein [Seminavis robusta]|uniref:Uncharacterized protein n=1 Tax=Seminavis robusta TaxID=568900 RepID=A0A9N8EL79_9STRA|nr:expressed unknown protein [Seminavis robusta]|eukprot:Sro1297_g260490.1 n/a (478) ;mRNA; r:17468-18901
MAGLCDTAAAKAQPDPRLGIGRSRLRNEGHASDFGDESLLDVVDTVAAAGLCDPSADPSDCAAGRVCIDPASAVGGVCVDSSHRSALGMNYRQDGPETYDFDAIPPQLIWHGKTLEFFVTFPNQTGTTSDSVQLLSQAHLDYESLNSSFGFVQYTPAREDKVAFNVTLQDTTGAPFTTFLITPVPDLPPETSIISSALKPSDDETPGEFSYTCQDSETDVLFNAEMRTIRKCQVIAEKDLELDWVFSGAQEDIQELEVFAETVTVASPVHLKQTDLTIYAKVLNISHPDAQIITTPASFPREEQEGLNGQVGHDGGNIVLHVKSLILPMNLSQPIFVTSGGRGQEQGPGKHGNDGISNTHCRGDSSCEFGGLVFDGHEILYKRIKHDKERFGDPDPTTAGKQEWPTNGTDATPAGVPGKGGNGGNFFSSVPMNFEEIVDTSGGLSGEDASITDADTKYDFRGGKAGEPMRSVMVEED